MILNATLQSALLLYQAANLVSKQLVVAFSNVKVVTNFVWHTVFGEDFTLEAGDAFQATFVALSTSDGDTACDTITIIDDDVLEGEHSFEIQIASTDPQLTIITPASAMVTIQDNEGTELCCCNDNSQVLCTLSDNVHI